MKRKEFLSNHYSHVARNESLYVTQSMNELGQPQFPMAHMDVPGQESEACLEYLKH